MNFFEIVGNNISKILNSTNMSQTSLAEKVGVSKQVMQKIIKGKKAINVLELKQIAEALKVNMEDLTVEPTVQNDPSSLVMFMGEFKNQKDYKFLNSIIEEIIDMEEDLNEYSTH